MRQSAARAIQKRTSNLEPRLAGFCQVFGIGLLVHTIQWMARSAWSPDGIRAEDFFRQAELYAWTPGFFLPNTLNLLINGLLFTLLALYLTSGRYSRAAFLLLWVVAISHFISIPERVSNHYFLAVWALGLLALIPISFRRTDPETVDRCIIILLRHLVCITYCFAFLHKLNTGFLSPETTSLRQVIPPVLLEVFNFADGKEAALANLFLRLLSIATLLTELALPILLVVKRTRVAGILLGLVFHGLITYLAGVIDYTVVILAFYFLFLDRDDRTTLKAAFKRYRWPHVAISLSAALGLQILPLTIGAGVPPFLDKLGGLFWFLEFLAGVAVLSVIAYCLIVWTPLLFARGKTVDRQDMRVSQATSKGGNIVRHRPGMTPALITLIALLDLTYILNGLSPYLGFKYYYSQAMYSNLRTSSAASNHLFIPHLGLFENEVYVRIHELEINPSPPENLLQKNRGLELLLENYPQHLVEKNFVRAVLGNACRKSDFKIRLRYQELRSGRIMAEKTVTCGELRKMDFQPINFYPWFRRPEIASSIQP